MNKLLIGAGIILLLFNGGQFFYTKNLVKLHDSEIEKIKKEYKSSLLRVIDSSSVEIDNIKRKSFIRFDSLLNIPPKKEYIRYEKPIYLDRTFDDAIIIHTDYKKSRK